MNTIYNLANLNVSNKLFCPEQKAASLTKFIIWPLSFEASEGF